MLGTLVLLLIIASWVYWAIAWWWTRELVHTRTHPDRSFAPPVSILKAVKGLDYEAFENFASFCEQDYPQFEILFAIADSADPVIPVIERVRRAYPERTIRLVIDPPTQVNRKASHLETLAEAARYDLLVASDSDMRVTPDYLRRVVAPFANPGIGLVTCPYRGVAPLTLTARLEALHMDATFLPAVTVARRFLNMHFALGATIAVRRQALAQIGGFAAVADFLADDFQLGFQIARQGYRVHLSDYVVACVLGRTTFQEQWQREVRWARCNRFSRPLEYPGLVLTFSTPLALLLVLATWGAPFAWLALAISLVVRWLVGWTVMGWIGNREQRRLLVFLPVRDLLSACVWCAGLVGRRIVWRGVKYRVRPDGRLEPDRPAPSRWRRRPSEWLPHHRTTGAGK